MTGTEVSRDGTSLTVHLPLDIRKLGGRKRVIAPNGTPSWAPRQPRIDTALIKALARAFRWRRLLEDGVYASAQEIASAEKINASYVARVLRLTLVKPEIVEAILDGQQGAGINLATLLRPFPVCWNQQGFAGGR